jgi:hypothetical protein
MRFRRLDPQPYAARFTPGVQQPLTGCLPHRLTPVHNLIPLA